MYIAFTGHQQGEYWNSATGDVHFFYSAFVFFSWFIPAAGVLYILEGLLLLMWVIYGRFS